VRTARRHYWAARERGDPDEIERTLREWVAAQIEAADAELGPRGWVVSERDYPPPEPPRPAGDDA
jgi:hypothetical protein